MIRTNQKIKAVYIILAVLIFNVLPAWAQDAYKYRATLQHIDSTGVYKIELKPDLVAKSYYKELYDIRVRDHNLKDVAYAISTHLTVEEKSLFVDFPEVKLNGKADTANVFVAGNRERSSIGNLWLRLKNNAVNRVADLSGSDDQQDWFAIKEDIELQRSNTGIDTDYEQVLDFPTSNYRYFRINVKSKNKDFVKITQAGIYVPNLIKTEYAALPPVKFSSTDKNKISSISVHLDEPYIINKLHLEVSAPKYYNRRVSIYDIESKVPVKLIDTMIASSGSQDISLSVKSSKLRIDIFNNDDSPLIIKSIAAYQLKQYLISYLQGGQDYYIMAGDSVHQQPSYDLSFLQSKAFSQLAVINHSAVYKNPNYKILQFGVKRDFTLFIWIAIAVSLLLLSLLTWRMVREINLKQNGE
ncbi:MAG TPA: hypothetical protein VK668_12740 [Mucilaginibacter sp.]|nr:hypothetical protein [Mucilaginibacter sp.]